MNQPTLLIGQVYAVAVPEDAWILKPEHWRTDFVINMGYLTYPRVGKKKWLSLDGMPGIKFLGLDYNEKAKGAIKLPPGNWQLIGTAKECTEETAAQIVERATGGFSGRMTGYKDYVIAGLDMQPLSKAVESLRTLLTSKGLDQNKNYVLIKKLP